MKWYNKPCSRRELKSGAGFNEALHGLFRFLDGTVMQSADRFEVRELREELAETRRLLKYGFQKLGDAEAS